MDGEQTAAEVKPIEIAGPSQWPEAQALKSRIVLSTGKRDLAFQVRAIAWDEYREMEDRIPLPEPPTAQVGGFETVKREDPKFQEEMGEVQFKRMVHIVDRCWKELPGSGLVEKCSWAEEHLWRDNQLVDLRYGIMHLSGFQAPIKEAVEAAELVEVSDPAAWAKETQAVTSYTFDRTSAKHVFKLRGIPRLKLNQISLATKQPEPPLRPKRGLAGTRGGLVPDASDARYKTAVRDVTEKRILLILEAALLFTLPGTIADEKLAWLRKRPAGDVVTLVNTITSELEYSERVSFLSVL